MRGAVGYSAAPLVFFAGSGRNRVSADGLAIAPLSGERPGGRGSAGAILEDPVVPATSPPMQRVYWHRELPPLDTEVLGEHTLEATSVRVPGMLVFRDELWKGCYADLMAKTRDRFEQEIVRLGGDCAHVFEESIDPRHDDATGEAWLHGVFEYVLYRRTDRA
jgi:hypothetical protein